MYRKPVAPKKKVLDVKKGRVYQKLFWTRIKYTKAQKTVFASMDETDLVSSVKDMICDAFSRPRKKKLTQAQKQERAAKKAAARQEKPKSKKTPAAKIVADDRIKKLEMAVARVRRDYRTIATSLVNMDEVIVDLEFAAKMFDVGMFPDPNESEQLVAYVVDNDGNTAGLNKVELFLHSLSRIERLGTRLECMKIKGNFLDDLKEVKLEIQTCSNAVTQVCLDNRFVVLDAVTC